VFSGWWSIDDARRSWRARLNVSLVVFADSEGSICGVQLRFPILASAHELAGGQVSFLRHGHLLLLRLRKLRFHLIEIADEPPSSNSHDEQRSNQCDGQADAGSI
jgi:hypothetical protein